MGRPRYAASKLGSGGQRRPDAERVVSLYAEDERSQLVDILSRSAVPSDGRQFELKPAARVVHELEGAARDVIEEFRRFRDGGLNEQLAIIGKLQALNTALNQIRKLLLEEPVRLVLAEYGNRLPDDADRLLMRLISATDFYFKRKRDTPRGIKSEGKAYSRHLASALLDRFLLFASIAFHDGTGRSPRPNKAPDGGPSGPYANFVLLSVAPLGREFEGYRRGLLGMTWRSLAQRLLKSAKVREIALLKP